MLSHTFAATKLSNLPLKKSISGIRGTIGNEVGDNLTPVDIVQFTSAYCKWLIDRGNKRQIVIGRDARISGELINQLVTSTVRAMGIDVIDLGLSTTPTVEMAVPWSYSGGGIILTASHNPKQWNALKLLNEKGEFLSQEDADVLLDLAENGQFMYAEVDDLGGYTTDDSYLDKHIQAVLDLELVDANAVRNAGFKVLVDGINSSGGIAVPGLLEALGAEVVKVNCEPTGHFAHVPEPLPKNLKETITAVKAHKVDVAFVADPDVDRLAIISEDGSWFGEEYTLVSIADYVLSRTPGNTVSNLSSTIALKEITEKRDGKYAAAAVGEVNVVKVMKETHAIIGGEGNGGVIYPALHYGRDALVGIALFLSQMARWDKRCSVLRNMYPKYHIAKHKVDVDKDTKFPLIAEAIKEKYRNYELNEEDGLKIYLDGSDWIHLRESNTEPIIRIYTESASESLADSLAEKMKQEIKEIMANKRTGNT